MTVFISVVLPTQLRQLFIGAVRGWQPALQLRSTLEQADSCYTKEYLPFAQANAKLSDDAFVDTLERQFAAKLLYVA